jgi:hypothetical protein
LDDWAAIQSSLISDINQPPEYEQRMDYIVDFAYYLDACK